MARAGSLSALLLLVPLAAAAGEAEVWIELDPPGKTVHEGSLPWFELRGWAGAGGRAEHDLMVAIDVSGSTAVASEVDVDGDGTVGRVSPRAEEHWRSFNPRRLSSDGGDTVLAAEVLATRRLIERLDLGVSRAGVLAFASSARVRAPVGSSREELSAALDAIDAGFGAGETSLAAAIERASDALLAARRQSPRARRQSILLVSDGDPNTPAHAREATRSAAERAAREGIHIHTYALGGEVATTGDPFPEIAALSGGRHVRLAEPGEIVHELAKARLTDVADVTVENVTTGAPARATRLFPDGSFDSLVPLEPGENRIRATALGDAGGRAVRERTVLYAPPESPDPAEIEAFREKLRARTVETELGARAQRGDEDPGTRELEVTVEDEKR